VNKQYLRVKSLVLENAVATAQSFSLVTSSGATIYGPVDLPSAVGGQINLVELSNGYCDTVPGDSLQLALGAATQVRGQVITEVKG
jgi:hypothetical protein